MTVFQKAFIMLCLIVMTKYLLVQHEVLTPTMGFILSCCCSILTGIILGFSKEPKKTL